MNCDLFFQCCSKAYKLDCKSPRVLPCRPAPSNHVPDPATVRTVQYELPGGAAVPPPLCPTRLHQNAGHPLSRKCAGRDFLDSKASAPDISLAYTWQYLPLFVYWAEEFKKVNWQASWRASQVMLWILVPARVLQPLLYHRWRDGVLLIAVAYNILLRAACPVQTLSCLRLKLA